ncbi:hypothetical protein NE865_09517 [Phthorimaea operculella]|nr:hypothetical protein NE865_09517 [Phthorimaea operculella]
MEEKLRNSAERMGMSKSVIRMVIKGVTKVVSKENYDKVCSNPDVSPDVARQFLDDLQNPAIELHINQTNSEVKQMIINTNQKEGPIQSDPNIRTNITELTVNSHKNATIYTLLEKMEKIMRRIVNDNMTIEEKLDKAKTLKSQMLEAFRRAYSNSDNLQNYLTVVEHGMKSAVEKVINNGTKTRRDKAIEIDQTNSEAEQIIENTNEIEGSIQSDSNRKINITEPAASSQKTATIYTMLKKIEKIMRRTVNDNMTVEEKLDKANTLKGQMLQAFRRAYSNSDKLQNYLTVVEHGMKSAVEKVINNGTKTRRNEAIEKDQTNSEAEQITENTNEIEGSIQSDSNRKINITEPAVNLHKPATIYTSLKKIEKILRRTINDNMTVEEKLDKANTLKGQMLQAFRRAYSNSDKLQNYLTVVEHGMKSAVEKVINNSMQTRRDEAIEIDQTNSESKQMTENKNLIEISIQNDTNEKINITGPAVNSHKTATIYTLLQKIEKIMRRTVNDNMTIEEKLDKANTLKNQMLGAFRRAYSNSDKLQNYLTVVEHGMKSALEKVIKNGTQTRRDEAIEIGEEAQTEEAAVPKQLNKANDQLNNVVKNLHSVFVPNTLELTSTTHFPGVTKPFGCKDILKDTCANLRTLDKFHCDYDGSPFEMHQICDGNVDCADGSDEKNCIQQVIGKIHKATDVMAKVEMSQNCFKSIIDKSLVTQQGQILSELLKMQVDFLNQITERGQPTSIKPGGQNLKKKPSNQTITRLAYEVAVVVRSFADTLVSSLCYIDDKLSTGINDVVGQDLDKEIEQLEIEARTVWLPSSCKCDKQYCANMTNCHQRCKRYCYQTFSLQSFNCKTNKKGQNGVSLDVVCDGKYDCVDQTDETNCTTDIDVTKFEGRKIFDQLIRTVETNSLTKVFTPVYSDMAELAACIHKLQKRSDTHSLNIELLKHAREKCFSKIVDIYDTILEEKDLPKEHVEVIYDFLLMTNENLVMALKHTNLGNKKIEPEDDCVCDGSACVQVKCRDRCVRYCAVKTRFTSYNCSGSAGNVSIPIGGICDGKLNCPNGEDELSCKKDFCRSHHLKLLRHNIQALCKRNEGGSIGVVLEEWKPKVEANLTALEKNKRLTLGVLKYTVLGLLNDLGQSYANLNPSRRQETDMMRLKKFTKFSQLVMEMLKECTK